MKLNRNKLFLLMILILLSITHLAEAKVNSRWNDILDLGKGDAVKMQKLNFRFNSLEPVEVIANQFYNVKVYGTKGDGIGYDTKSINKTIETAASVGGGTVYFPAGNYLTGSIRLKSNITLFIDQGATIIAAPPEKDAGYDLPEHSVSDTYQDFGHSHWHNSLIWRERLHDVSIIGHGRIWGEGLVKKDKDGDTEPNKSISLYRW